MTQSKLIQAAFLMTALAGLTACDGVRESLGLTRHTPDESLVVARPTLTLPPDFDLRPPGTETAVSGAHEENMSAGGMTATASAAPKESRGWFSWFFDMFEDSPNPPPPAPGPAK